VTCKTNNTQLKAIWGLARVLSVELHQQATKMDKIIVEEGTHSCTRITRQTPSIKTNTHPMGVDIGFKAVEQASSI